MMAPKSNDGVWINLSHASSSNLCPEPTKQGYKPESFDDSEENAFSSLAKETLDDLDWCLHQLSTINTRMSVSNMTRDKLNNMLNDRLSMSGENLGNEYGEGKNTNKQTQDYILNTFLDRESQLQKVYRADSFAVSILESCPLGSLRGCSSIEDLAHDGCNLCPLSKDYIPKFGIECAKEDDLEKCLQNMNNWGFDIFLLNEITCHQPLATIAYNIFLERNLFTILKIPRKTCLVFLVALENSYRRANPFHNSIHAADVTQTVHVLLSMNALDDALTPLEIISALFAAAVHDAGHPGVTNQFLINTGAELALLYNDESVLENFHASTAFKILQNEKCNMIINFSKEQRLNFRKTVIDLVLATDMSKHITLIADMKTMLETRHFRSSGCLNLDDYSDKSLVLQTMVHCADLSNPVKSLPLYIKWVDLIMEEFFQQGDRERKLNMEISPMCDRFNASIEKTQVGFIDFVIFPLWETFADLVNPEGQGILDTLEGNKQYFQANVGASKMHSDTTKHDSFKDEDEQDIK